ncbi:MAG TPA: hypothetical protein P5038_12755 [Candidatus Paceibacterota bacterium]|nr:hypothetical protein [Candidatus Paceibacterota bacterium]
MTGPEIGRHRAIAALDPLVAFWLLISFRAGPLEIAVTLFAVFLANPLAFFGPGRRRVLLADGLKRRHAQRQRCDKQGSFHIFTFRFFVVVIVRTLARR